MKTLIVGMGEVGQALESVLYDYSPWGINKELLEIPVQIEIMHICFPYSDNFIQYVKEYQEKYKPKYTVVHSTVVPGTCRQLNAISSPILGIHPNLENGIRTFTKFLGGEQANEVADYFRRVGIKIYIFDKSETCELMKILDTTFYGMCIEYTKDVKKQCEKFDVPFEAWTLWTENYNQGYKKLGHSEFLRPNLVPIKTKIKGHCILQNTELLETIFTKFLKETNV